MPPPGLILLAAGSSSRMGRPKQLLPWEGVTLLRHACQTALKTPCHPLIVVLGCEAESCARELLGLEVLSVTNARWPRGMGTSIATGVAALENHCPAATSALLMLVDQPGISPELLASLLARSQEDPARIAATRYPHGGGVPAVFPRSFFSALRSLDADQGARALITPSNSILIDAPADALVDLDTHESYLQTRP